MLPVFALSQWYFLNYINNKETIDILNTYAFAGVALYGSIFTIAVSILIAPMKFSNFFERIGRNSLQIYVMHVIISSAFRIAATELLGLENVYLLLSIGLVTSIFVPLYIVELSRKYPKINWLFAPPK